MTFADLIAAVETSRKTITLYAPEERRDVVDLFATRNVAVERVRIPADGPGGFAVIRDDDGFVGAIGLDELETLLEPPIRRPWDEDFVEGDTAPCSRSSTTRSLPRSTAASCSPRRGR